MMTGEGDTDKDFDMPRVENWERVLAEAIDIARAKPFIWGLHDCPTFAFEARMLLTDGEDTAALWRGRYTTALGGQRVMRRFDWSSIEEMGRGLLGEPRATALLAQRGDIVLADTGLGFGICTGATAVGMAPEGLVTVPLTFCRLAWPI
tara:strand:+ start:501 stop:947 length:447 start_codon:yes stop_codon:yes gene_type:complete